MKLHSQKGFIVQGIIGVVLLLLIIGGAYYGVEQYKAKQPLTYSSVTEQSKEKYSIQYPSTWVYFKFSCNIDGLAFWPKEKAPVFPTTNKCPSSIVSTAPIIIITATKLEMVVNDIKYQEATKQFIITPQ